MKLGDEMIELLTLGGFLSSLTRVSLSCRVVCALDQNGLWGCVFAQFNTASKAATKRCGLNPGKSTHWHVCMVLSKVHIIMTRGLYTTRVMNNRMQWSVETKLKLYNILKLQLSHARAAMC